MRNRIRYKSKDKFTTDDRFLSLWHTDVCCKTMGFNFELPDQTLSENFSLSSETLFVKIYEKDMALVCL